MTSAASGFAGGSLLRVRADARSLEIQILAGSAGLERLLACDIPSVLIPGEPENE